MSEEFSRRRFVQGAFGCGIGTSLASVRGEDFRDREPTIEQSRAEASGKARGHWWEREPLSFLELATCWSFAEVTAREPAALMDRKSALSFNVDQLHVMGMAAGLDDSQFFFASKAAAARNEDYLGRYVSEAQKRHRRVFIYFNVHWYKPSFAARHPDWVQMRENGEALTGVYETGTSFCVNSPWREWTFQVVRDLCAYAIDGICFDGPIFFPDTCYCRSCQEKFQKLYGAKLPSKRQREGKPARDLLEFQARSLADFLHDARSVIKSINTEIAFYMNGGERGGNWSTGRLNRVLVPEQDLLGSEGGFIYGDLTRTPIWKPGVTARLLETQAAGKPRIVFSAGSHKPWTYSMLPEAELRLLYAQSVANAAAVWVGVTPFEFDQPEMKALADMNRFVSSHAGYYLDTKSEATAAIVWSDVTANFYAGANAQRLEGDRVAARSEVGDLNAEFSGITDALLRAQVPFDVIDDVALEQEPLTRYAAVFLPNVACMSEKTAAALKDYVRNGGNLFATFETSKYDDIGASRNEFALADVFGIGGGRDIAGPHRWDFMKPCATSPLLEGITREFIPCPVYHVRVSLRGCQPLLYYTQPLAGTYDAIPGISDEPALVTNRFGKGQAVYCSGDLGNAVNTFHLLEHLRLIRNTARIIAPPPVLVEKAPSSLEIVLRSQMGNRRLLLHLINYTGEMTRPIQKVLPLQNVAVSVRTRGELKKAYTLRHPGNLTWENSGTGYSGFVVPRIDDYEVLVMER
jgi:hypothetical protein